MSGVLFFDSLAGTPGTRQGVPELMANYVGIYQNVQWGGVGPDEGLAAIGSYDPSYYGYGAINGAGAAWSPTLLINHKWRHYYLDIPDQNAPVTVRVHVRCHSQGNTGNFTNGKVGIRVGTVYDGDSNDLGEAFLTAAEVENGIGRTLSVTFTTPTDAEAYVSEVFIKIGLFDMQSGLAAFTIEYDQPMYEAGPGDAPNAYGTGAPGPLPTFTDRPYNYGKVEHGNFGPGSTPAVKLWGYTPNMFYPVESRVAGAIGVRFILDSLPNSGEERIIAWCGEGSLYTELLITSSGAFKIWKTGGYSATFSSYTAGTAKYVELWVRKFLGNAEAQLYIDGSYAGTVTGGTAAGDFQGGGFGDVYTNNIYDNVGCTYQDFYVKDMVADTTLLGPNIKVGYYEHCDDIFTGAWTGDPANLQGATDDSTWVEAGVTTDKLELSLPDFSLIGGSLLAVAPDPRHNLCGTVASNEWSYDAAAPKITTAIKLGANETTAHETYLASAPRTAYEYDSASSQWRNRFNVLELDPAGNPWTTANLSSCTMKIGRTGTDGIARLLKMGVRVLYTGTLFADYSGCGVPTGPKIIARRSTDWKPGDPWVRKNQQWRQVIGLWVIKNGVWRPVL